MFSDEPLAAEYDIFRMIQREAFARELRRAEEVGPTNKDMPSPRGELKRLNPKLINGLLRVDGRLTNAHLNFDTKYPILLPARQPVVELMIQHVHAMEGHAGESHGTSVIRKRLWLL